MKRKTIELGLFLLLTAAVSIAQISCNNGAKSRLAKDRLDTLVARIEADTPRCITDTLYWGRAEKEYQGVYADVNEQYPKMNEVLKQEVNLLEKRYRTAHDKFLQCDSMRRRIDQMRFSMFGEHTDAGFTNVNEKNIGIMYEKFVKNVKENLTQYGPEDWKVVGTIYDKLDDLRNMYRSKLSKSEEHIIANLTFKYNKLLRERESKEKKVAYKPKKKKGKNSEAMTRK